MLTILLILLAAVVVIGLLIVVGVRSRTVIVDPGALPDRQIEATIAITRRIMQRSRPGSVAWQRAAARHKAARDEQLRRAGKEPFDEIQIAER